MGSGGFGGCQSVGTRWMTGSTKRRLLALRPLAGNGAGGFSSNRRSRASCRSAAMVLAVGLNSPGPCVSSSRTRPTSRLSRLRARVLAT